VELIANQQPVDLCGLLKRIELPQPDLGFAFLPQYRNQVFALEAVKLVLADVCERRITDKVLAITSIDNEKSINLLKKLDFSFIELIRSGDNVDETRLFELILET